MGRFFALFVIVIGLAASILAPSIFNRATAAYDIYITVGKGNDGEDGPVGGAQVTLTSPSGAKESKRSDDEGAVRFTVSATGRYGVTVTAAGFDTYEGRVIVDGKDPQIYHMAALVPAKVQDAVQIRVRVKDDETGLPIEGASIETVSKATPYTDRMTSDADGEAVVRVPLSQWKRDTDYVVTVSHREYASWTHVIKADNRSNRVYSVDASLIREKNLTMVAFTILEEGTRAPILGANIKLDGGGERYFTGSTQGNGQAIFRIPKGAIYKVTVSTKVYEEHTDTIDLVGAGAPSSLSPTYELTPKPGGKDIRRALIVYVKYKEDGQTKPLKGAVVAGPGLHSQATDESGRFIFLHRVPPGETITVTASHELFKSGSATVLVRDKGVMVDLDQFSRDTNRGGMSDYDAIMKQGVRAFDTCQIVLESAEEKVRRIKGQIHAPDETDPGESAEYEVELNYEEGDTDAVTVEEVIVIYGPDGKIFARAGNIRALNAGEPSRKAFTFTPTKGGTYRIKCTVSGPPIQGASKEAVLWTGEATVRVTENRVKAVVTGSVVPKKGLVKLDEQVTVAVNVLYEAGPSADLRVSEIVELFDPSGQVVQNNFSHRNLKRQAYSERNFNIVCQAPGPYRLRSTIKDESGTVLWTGEGGFTVDKVGKSVMQQGTGYFRLKDKVLGRDPGGGEGPYGFVSATVSESSFTYKYTPKAPWDAYADINIQWSTPPTVLKPNDSIELTVSGTGSVRGKDRGYVGVGAGWSAEGSASVVEGRNMFVGLAADGKHYDSGSAKFKIAIGRGGAIKIYNHHGGAPGTNATAGVPCAYHYEWIEGAAPPSPTGKPTMNAGSENIRTDDPNAYSSNAVEFGSFGTFSLSIKIGKDFSGSGKSKDGKSIITLYGSVNANGKLSGTGTLTRNGTKYTINVTGQKGANEVVGEMSVKASKGTIKGQFRLKKGQ